MIFFKGSDESDDEKLERLKKERLVLEEKDKLASKIIAEEKKINELKSKKKKGSKLGKATNWLGDYAKDISKNFEGDDKK